MNDALFQHQRDNVAKLCVTRRLGDENKENKWEQNQNQNQKLGRYDDDDDG
jgi:hypothetical protein